MTAANRLRAHLEALHAGTDVATRLAADPVAFVHRYDRAGDREIAAAIASSLAFGRVSLFRPVLEAVFDHLDRLGGPEAGVRADPAAHHPLRPLYYRWTRGADLVVWLAALGAVQAGGGLERAFDGDDARTALIAGVGALRRAAVEVAARCEVTADRYEALPRGLRHLLPTPATGSACKRWNLFLRWMVRRDGVDLGLWTRLRPGDLVIPLDVHVLRISRFLGLTTRKDGSWRTAAEITARLTQLDPEDPVRFDFALSHLGISGGCLGRRDPVVCPGCPLNPICTA